jgi:hypothetical protein
MPAADYLRLMLVGYCLTVAVELAVLLVLLSRRHSLRVRVFAGVWLTACTYPVVWLVLPPLFDGQPRWLYLLVAETFAPVAECAIFWFAFVRPLPPVEVVDEEEINELTFDRRATVRDFVAITLANLCSFGVGEVLIVLGVFGA